MAERNVEKNLFFFSFVNKSFFLDITLDMPLDIPLDIPLDAFFGSGFEIPPGVNNPKVTAHRACSPPKAGQPSTPFFKIKNKKTKKN